MRSTLKTITFATIALSLAAGGAFAAGKPHQIIRSDSDHGDDMSISRPMPVETPMMVRKLHLDQILAGLHSAERKIEHGEAAHRLSASAVRKLEGEAGGIRHHAMTVADAHHGAIPNATFQRLRGDIRKLDRDIVRMS